MVTLRVQLGEKFPVTISVDDGNLGFIVVFSPETNEAIRVPALRQAYAEGLTSDQHRAIRQYARLKYGKIDVESDYPDNLGPKRALSQATSAEPHA